MNSIYLHGCIKDENNCRMDSLSVNGRIQKSYMINYGNIHMIKKQYGSCNNWKTFYKELYVT